MKDVSNSVVIGNWRRWSNPSPAVPPQLSGVAAAFVDLQEKRHQADYDNAKTWSAIEVRNLASDVHDAFENWTTVRDDPTANEYLLSLLIGNKRG